MSDIKILINNNISQTESNFKIITKYKWLENQI